MSNILDWSWARPDLSQVKAQGYLGVFRYLAHDTTGKAVTLAEANNIRGAGLGLGLVFEDGASQAQNGHDQGVADATFALASANAIGFPSDRPIYFAVDFDEADTDASNNAIYAYFDGVASVIGLDRVGVYGGYYVVKRVLDNGKAKWAWQTVAWSGGQVDSRAVVLQNAQSAFNGGADIDVVEKGDWGGWGAGAAVTPTPASPTPPAASAPSSSAGPGGTYTVVKNDTLSGIGSKTGSDWRAIAALNGIGSPYTIFPGQVLHLPGATATPATPTNRANYTVKSGDTLSGIGSDLGVSWQAIAAANGIGSPYVIYPGQVLSVPGAAASAPAPAPTPARTYTVVGGDTLSGIGEKTNESWQAIASKNGIGSPYIIYPNEVLQLP